MSTQENCEELVTRFNGWNLDGDHGVLKYYNQAHNILMSQECSQNLVLDESTGNIPILTTVAGYFAYNAAADVWRVTDVLVSADDKYLVDYESEIRKKRRNEVVIAGMRFWPFPFVRQKQDWRGNNSPARIVFSQDPGDTTDRFYLQQYRRPTDILSLTIEGDIAPPYDVEILIPATAKLIEGVLSGNYIEAQQVLRQFKMEMARILESGVQGDYDDEPVRRDF
jgi:hypothetical protein